MVLPVSNTPCLAHELKNGPTCILAVAVWLKLNHKYFNEGMTKEACDQFEVRAKQLSRVLTGRKYLGGTQAKKHKATDEPPVRRKKADTQIQHLKDENLTTTTSHHGAYGCKTIVSPSLHKSSQQLISSSHLASAPSSSTGSTRQDSSITSPVQPPTAAFSPLPNHV